MTVAETDKAQVLGLSETELFIGVIIFFIASMSTLLAFSKQGKRNRLKK